MSVVTEYLEPRDERLRRFRFAVAEDLMTLALLHDRELDRETIQLLRQECYASFLGLQLQRESGREAMALLRAGLSDIPAVIDSETLDVLAVEYADIYLNHSLGASPCESVWIDDDHLTMQEPMFRIRACYQRHGLAVVDWRRRTDDHLVNQLHFLSHLIDLEDGLKEAARFMDEHVLRWIGDFAERVSPRCSTRFYAGLARLTAAYLDELRDLLARLLDAPRPTPEEIEKRLRPLAETLVAPPGPFVPGTAPSW